MITGMQPLIVIKIEEKRKIIMKKLEDYLLILFNK